MSSEPVDSGAVIHLTPEGLHVNPAFTQAIAVHGPMRTVYVGGQNAVNDEGAVVGEGDIGAQTEQVLRNLEIALEAGGARLEHVVKWSIYAVAGQPVGPALEVFQRVWGRRGPPPVITVVFVVALANPAFLVEIDAIAVVPEIPKAA